MKSFTNTFFSKARRDLNKLNHITDENTLRAQPMSKPTSLSICAKVIRASRLEHPTQSTPFAPHPSPRPTVPYPFPNWFPTEIYPSPRISVFLPFSIRRCPQKVTNPCLPCRNVFNPCSKPPTYPCPRIWMILWRIRRTLISFSRR